MLCFRAVLETGVHHFQWEPTLARNRSPAGRSHHTASYHASGRSILVFGGYVGGQGHVNELWAFNMDHLEWWQPDTAGEDMQHGVG